MASKFAMRFSKKFPIANLIVALIGNFPFAMTLNVDAALEEIAHCTGNNYFSLNPMRERLQGHFPIKGLANLLVTLLGILFYHRFVVLHVVVNVEATDCQLPEYLKRGESPWKTYHKLYS